MLDQPIDVTYEKWNEIYPDSDNDQRHGPRAESLGDALVAGAPPHADF